MRSSGLAAVVALLLVMWCARVEAQTAHNEAREHFDRGLTLLNTQNFEGALAEFQRSYDLSPRPSVLYNIAVTLQSLHRYPEAAHSIERYLHDATNLRPERRTEVEHALVELRALIAHLRIVAEPVGAQIRLDGQDVGTAPLADAVEVGPGRHVVEAVVNGTVTGTQEVTIASGETRELRFAAPSVRHTEAVVPPPPSPRLFVRGVPAGGLAEIDDRAAATDRAVELAPGTHRVRVRVPGRAPWQSTVRLSPGEQHVIVVRVPRDTGLAPTAFYASLAGSLALGAAAAGFAIATQVTHDEFGRTFQGDPNLSALAARGTAFETATNVMLVATGLLSVTTVVVLTQTRFHPPAIDADVALVPLPSGAAASIGARF